MSGTFTGSRSGGSTGPYLTLSWAVTSTDIPNNRSRVRLTLRLNTTGALNFSASKSGTLHGSGFTYTGGAKGTSGWLIRQQDLWVGHNSDGTKSQSFSANFNIAITYSGTYISTLSVSGTATLPVIPRASSLTAFSFASSLQASTAVTINYTVGRKNDGFRHQIRLLDGTHEVEAWDNVSSNGASTLTLSATRVNQLLARMSKVTSRSLTLRVSTRSGNNGGWVGGAVTRNATVSINANVAPSVGAVTVSQTGNSVSTDILQTISRITASFSPTAGYGSSITSSSITIRRKTTNNDVQTINSASGTTARAVALFGTYQAQGTARDARGRTTSTAWLDFAVVQYVAPTITTFTAVRRENLATTVDIERAGVHTPLGAKNILTWTVQRRSGTGAWANVNTNPTGTSTTASFMGTSTSTGNDVATSYDFRLVLTDKFNNTAEAIVSVSTQRVVLDIHQNEGVGIGKIHERGALDVDGTVYMNGKIMALGGLGFEDTRTINEQPREIPGQAFSFAFKTSSYINHPPIRAHNNYAHILNVAGWSSQEGSGGYPMQMSIGGEGISLRQGTSTTTWSDWKSLVAVERGSNANGEYIRLYDGTQICWSNYLGAGLITENTFGNSLTSTAVDWTFPASFSGNPALMVGARRTGGGGAFGSHNGGMSSTGATGLRMLGTNIYTTGVLQPMAIGRWK